VIHKDDMGAGESSFDFKAPAQKADVTGVKLTVMYCTA